MKAAPLDRTQAPMQARSPAAHPHVCCAVVCTHVTVAVAL